MNYLDIAILVPSVATVFLSWQIYRITRAKSVLYIFMAMLIGVATRILIIYNYPYTSILAAAFWLLWALGLFLLLRVLKKYIKC